MLSLAYAAGLRVSELLGLTLADLDRSRGVVSAYGKGGKRRLVPIGELCLNHVDAYLRAYPARQEANRRGLLFASPRGKPYSRQMFWKLVKRYAYRAGLAGDVHPHRLRHSFATHLLAGGADLRSVQTLLGHADVSTTEVYTYVSQPQIRAAHHASHPRG